ncbi:hypothetical protein EJP82_27510 [Paenibacillus anaericanus]|uniref:Uncharacterized protein n=1 Tax=Paenibacillus anaericanus TaxID=170367 RepID=A0A3S1DCE4_9BACL|nr:hypothetical protein [Paenibacillus anaericanus]RUT37911.1 hypothetical protein EJP82_27510 [Paenibacillus anaericanus]
MFIKLFIEGISQSDAENELWKIMQERNYNLQSLKIEQITNYWKLESVYVCEVTLMLKPHVNEEEFLYKLSNKWLFFEDEQTEALCSDTMEGCTIYCEKIKMINAFY